MERGGVLFIYGNYWWYCMVTDDAIFRVDLTAMDKIGCGVVFALVM